MVDPRIISLEGLNGSGKTTAIQLLRARLGNSNWSYEHIPPKKGHWAQAFSKISHKQKISRSSDLFLMYVSCYISEIHRLLVQTSNGIILDRSIISTLAYFNNIPIGTRLDIARSVRLPYIVFLFLPSEDITSTRLRNTEDGQKQEEYNLLFRIGYTEIVEHIERMGSRVILIDASQTAPAIADQIQSELRDN